jgi:hypothetical protein
MNLDPATDLPRCYGHEDPRSNTCLTCEFQLTCRETLKMGAGNPVLIITDKAEDEEIRSLVAGEGYEDDPDTAESDDEEEPSS